MARKKASRRPVTRLSARLAEEAAAAAAAGENAFNTFGSGENSCINTTVVSPLEGHVSTLNDVIVADPMSTPPLESHAHEAITPGVSITTPEHTCSAHDMDGGGGINGSSSSPVPSPGPASPLTSDMAHLHLAPRPEPWPRNQAIDSVVAQLSILLASVVTPEQPSACCRITPLGAVRICPGAILSTKGTIHMVHGHEAMLHTWGGLEMFLDGQTAEKYFRFRRRQSPVFPLTIEGEDAARQWLGERSAVASHACA